MEDLRQQARAALLEGAQSGKLQEAQHGAAWRSSRCGFWPMAMAQEGIAKYVWMFTRENDDQISQNFRYPILRQSHPSTILPEVLAHKEQEANNIEDLRVKARDALLTGRGAPLTLQSTEESQELSVIATWHGYDITWTLSGWIVSFCL